MDTINKPENIKGLYYFGIGNKINCYGHATDWRTFLERMNLKPKDFFISKTKKNAIGVFYDKTICRENHYYINKK